jgi:hypothetical protein
MLQAYRTFFFRVNRAYGSSRDRLEKSSLTGHRKAGTGSNLWFRPVVQAGRDTAFPATGARRTGTPLRAAFPLTSSTSCSSVMSLMLTPG